jgi:hypothetical protein
VLVLSAFGFLRTEGPLDFQVDLRLLEQGPICAPARRFPHGVPATALRLSQMGPIGRLSASANQRLSKRPR